MSDIENVTEALNLEYGANRRYAYQIEQSPFSQLNNILEGIRRTEGDHVEAMMAYIKSQIAAAPEKGRGFAAMLAHLRLNLEFEKTALATYGKFAREASDPALKATFQQLARSEAGHINLFKGLIEQIEANQYPVLVYCPVCGWEMDYGINPAEGTVIRCAKCKQQIEIRLHHGDYVLNTL
ncbi:MAG TPA: ferritin-like domain-containing protein [Armatimonadota bacterium]|nr:ferritin-like domain-containing protein [Armatimonadota bacterium]